MSALNPKLDLEYHLLSDARLLERTCAKDELAWRELIRRFRGLIFRCISKVAGKYGAVLAAEDVNEIFGDVCINLLRDDTRKLRAYDPSRGAKLSSWLGLITINTAYDYLRQTARRPLLDRLDGAPERAGETPSALDDLIEKERWSCLNALLSEFSDRDRRFVELYYGAGLMPDEVAARMGISVKTVYSKKNKLRTKLQALAAAQGDDDGARRRAA
jgi:RNA polymerase sigma-70 factor (ECF subfamily)